MSRKTRKLIWSAPLVAVLAVVGALTAFATLSPGGVLAQSATMDPPTGLKATVNSPTQITLEWTEPVSTVVSSYRIDVAKDEDAEVWEKLVTDGNGPQVGPSGSLTTSVVSLQGGTGKYVHGSAAGNVGALDPSTTYHYRVFANYLSGVTSGPTVAVTATTLPAKAPAPPTGLIASTTTVPTADTITLTWIAPTGTATGGLEITGYKVEASKDGGPWQTLNANYTEDASDTETGVQYTHDKLTAGTPWRYRVSSISKAGTGLASDPLSTMTADGVLPGAPTDPSVQGTKSSMILRWKPPTDPVGAPVTGYIIQRKANADNPATADVDESAVAQWAEFARTGKATFRNVGSSTTGFKAGSPLADVSWDFRIYSINSVGDGTTASTELTGASPPDPAANSKVRGLKAVPRSGTAVRLSWEVPNNGTPTSYDVVGSKDQIVWQDVSDTDPTASPFDHTGLKPGETWYYRVTPSDGTNSFVWSEPVSTTTRDTQAPGAPTALVAAAPTAATEDASTQVNLTWTAPTDDIGTSVTGYKIERSEDLIDWEVVGESEEVGSTGDEYKDKGLTPATEYHYRVRAMNAAGTGNASIPVVTITTAAATTAPALGIPSGLVAIARGSSQIDLYWLTPGDSEDAPITGYRVEYSEDDGTTWKDAIADTMSRATMASHTGRMAETKYTYRVSAINAGGTGAPSTDASATTGMLTVPGVPMSVTASATSDTAITVTWGAPANQGGSAVTGYVLQRKSGTGDFMTIAATDASTWWETLDCPGMVAAVPADAVGNTGMANMDNPYCAHYPGSPAVMGGAAELATAQKDVVDATFMANYGTITGMSYMDMGLMAETTYYYRVRAANAEGYGAWSDGMAMARTEATPPELMAPTNLRVNASGSGIVLVDWDPVADAAGFYIIATSLADVTDQQTAVINNPSATAGAVNDLTVGSEYLIIVYSFKSSTEFQGSDYVRVIAE